MKKSFLILGLIGLFVACSPKFITPTQLDVDRVQEKFPDYTLANLNLGMNLYQSKCSTCHSAKSPRSLDEAGWKDIVPKMVEKANKKQPRISPEEHELILKYLITMGKQG